jgi:hypothetical protein
MRVLLVFLFLVATLQAAVRVQVGLLPGHVEFRWTEDGKLLKSKPKKENGRVGWAPRSEVFGKGCGGWQTGPLIIR